MSLIVAQVVVALGLIIVGAQVFVGAVDHLATQIGLDRTILALIIAPIATELPEKFNSVLWVRNGKDTLAMGNITGAMVFQSCLPTVLGLLFTTWTFTGDSAISFASAGVAILATLIIFGNMLRTGRLSAWSLLIGGPLYLVYVYLALFTPLGARRRRPLIPQLGSPGERPRAGYAGILLASSRRRGASLTSRTHMEARVLKQESRPKTASVETTTELWAFFRGEFVPLRDANINVMTHGFNYGTAVFEGIRAYWNADEEQLFGLELIAHYERIRASAALLMMEVRTVGRGARGDHRRAPSS